MENLSKLDPKQQHQVLFLLLVQQHEQLAMMAMGKLKNPVTDKTERDLSQARFAIDTLEMLREYTNGRLNKEEADYLEFTLTNLRLNYVAESKQP